ncbi:MAG TPA: phosphoglucosamine mutase [Candidatus Cybelea sp.]|jgi:phosphoglucosamine mutase|nr:phosphoglucosamine mutase [Candidatus Cybelea sp.]
MSRLFGTDGVRGVANRELTPELAMQIGRAAAGLLPQGARRKPVAIGRDTRVSGTMIESALVAGLTSAGYDAISLGIVPTPGVACVTRAVEAAAGIVISASHNPIEDNGIKIFGPDGFKLSDEIESRIEASLAFDLARPTGTGVGIARVAQNLVRHYYHELYEGATELDGVHVIVDGGFGAAYAIAPYALRKLGARVSEINCKADGARINVASGATDLSGLRAAVRERIESGERTTIGVAFDGDADRALFVDETGEVVTGDHVLFALGCAMKARHELAGDTIVTTQMSNVGFERALRNHGIGLVRAAVGDRYVLEQMQRGGYNLGGEQSGHVIDFRYNTTGDGPRTAITLLGLVASQNVTLHELVREVVYAPQILLNVRTNRRDVLEHPAVIEAIAAAELELADSGRIFVRASGTEPLIRVMAEGDNRTMVEQIAARVAQRIEQEVARFVST